MIGMKIAMLTSFHSRLKPADLRWVFTRWVFLIKQIFFLSNFIPLKIALSASFTFLAWNAEKGLWQGWFPLWMTTTLMTLLHHTHTRTRAHTQGRIGLNFFFLFSFNYYVTKTFKCQYLFYLKGSKTSIFQEACN